jgi:hypothetical protein
MRTLKIQDNKKNFFALSAQQHILDTDVALITPRHGWAAAAERMHQAGDDELLLPDVFKDEELDEWK